jgi:GNAT superfamily N-acetyltransferase
MKFRKLEIQDYYHYKTLICSNISESYFKNFINNTLNKNHIIIVIVNNEDTSNNHIIGSGTLLIEEKLTYGGCKMAHIENIFIDEKYRGFGYGIQLINKLIEVADTNKCYRVELNCDENLIKFYAKTQFKKYQTAMSLILPHNFS